MEYNEILSILKLHKDANLFLGVDIAGQSNTWVAILDENLRLLFPPSKLTLLQIFEICTAFNVVAVTIDAQLSYSIDEENGFRNNDFELRSWLYSYQFDPNFVQSQNSLQAVPIRGRQLAEELKNSSFEGVILETHPRFVLAQMSIDPRDYLACNAVSNYKGSGSRTIQSICVDYLFNKWCSRYLIQLNHGQFLFDDGVLDSLVCSTISFQYLNQKKLVEIVPHRTKKSRMFGPLCVHKF